MLIIEKNTFKVTEISENTLTTFSCGDFAVAEFDYISDVYDADFVADLEFSQEHYNSIFQIVTGVILKPDYEIAMIKLQREIKVREAAVYERFRGYKFIVEVDYPYLYDNYKPLYDIGVMENNYRKISYNEDKTVKILSFWNNLMPDYEAIILSDDHFKLFTLQDELNKVQTEAAQNIDISIGIARPEQQTAFHVINTGEPFYCEVEIFLLSISYGIFYSGAIGEVNFAATLPQGEFYVRIFDLSRNLLREKSFIVK